MERNRRYYTDANRAAWDEVAPLHAEQNLDGLLRAFREPGYSTLQEHCRARLMDIGVAGKSVAQVCCNNGRELLSLKNLGAGRCVGFDASAPFIEQARRLTEVTGHQDVTFIATDLYDIPRCQEPAFDVVVSTIGVLSWMPDLPAFFEVVAGLTNGGGHLLVEEMHPVLLMYEPGEDGAGAYLAHSYFDRAPLRDTRGLDYYGGNTYDARPNFSFQHTREGYAADGADVNACKRSLGYVARPGRAVPDPRHAGA